MEQKLLITSIRFIANGIAPFKRNSKNNLIGFVMQQHRWFISAELFQPDNSGMNSTVWLCSFKLNHALEAEIGAAALIKLLPISISKRWITAESKDVIWTLVWYRWNPVASSVTPKWINRNESKIDRVVPSKERLQQQQQHQQQQQETQPI